MNTTISKYRLILPVTEMLFLSAQLSFGQSWCAGVWDSTINNLVEHPKTVAVRVEVVDAETRLPISGAEVLCKGAYTTEATTSRDPQGDRDAELTEFELKAKTGNDGIAVVALGWQKEYPWRRGIDNIEKAQFVEVRHPSYGYAREDLPFSRVLNVGQDNNSSMQEPGVVKAFEKAVADEAGRGDVVFCTLDLGSEFNGFQNTESSRPEFFEQVRNKQWGRRYSAQKNWFSKGDASQSLCGPYFVYSIEVGLKKRASLLDINM